MNLHSDDSRHDLLGDRDDLLHEPPRDWWYTETWWFAWYAPAERLGGWLYQYVRPNIGTAMGGVWIWDSESHSHLDAPYYASYANLRHRPPEDPSTLRFPSGATIEVERPMEAFALRHHDEDRLVLDLRFEATMPPWVDPRRVAGGQPPRHLDQFGTVTGTMTLLGREIPISCHAIRDRTWDLRSERWKQGQHGYCTGADDDLAFLVTTAMTDDSDHDGQVRGGFLAADGRRSWLVDGERRLERDPEHGFVRRVTIEAEDAAGRRLSASGESLSRLAMPIPGVHGVCWTSLVDWNVDGARALGDDQDAWPLHAWSALRRTRRSEARA